MNKQHRTLHILSIVAILATFFTTGFEPNTSFPSGAGMATFTSIDFHANIETLGVIVNGINLPSSAELMYRRTDELEWKLGHPLMNIEGKRLVGSLFELSESTLYEVRVEGGETQIGGFITTQPNQLQFTPSRVLYVDNDAAPGGDGSAMAPFQTIQLGLNSATPGTQVLVADGIYREEVNFLSSGAENNWIQVKAAGQNAILDGSRELSGDIWEPSNYKNVWYTRVVTIFQYLARDGERYFRFESLADLVNTRVYGNTRLKEGWFFDTENLRLYVRSLDDPSEHIWQLPMLDLAFSAKEQNWLWIEGFEIRHYGTTTSSSGIFMTDSSHVVIRKNKIHNIQIGVFIKWLGKDFQRGNDTRIEYNEIYDPPVDEWPWMAVKATSMEGTAIIARGHIGTIVRGNKIHNYFNGIYTGSSGDPNNFELALDVDIYDNYIHHISDDAFEPEGGCVNHRFHNNIVEDVFVGLSLAPVTFGPTWTLKNVFATYSGRGIKMDRQTDGIALVYHNTFWSNENNVNAIDLISPAHNTILRNNIFQSNGYLVKALHSGSTGNYWDTNNLHTTHSILIPDFIWEGKKYFDIKNFCKASTLECNSFPDDPGFVSPEQGIYALLANSPNIDRGIVLPGVNDNFTGNAPDVGAYEYDPFRRVPAITSIVAINDNPAFDANITYRVTFTEPVLGIDYLPPFHNFELFSNPTMTTAVITNIAQISSTTYDVSVNTNGQEGIIRLDVVDDNSIFGQGRTPLGGPEAGDGTYKFGESYIVDSMHPTVTQILLADPNPTLSDMVRFEVTFSEPVNGVDISDFTVDTNGTLLGATITSVTGAGNTYFVTVNTIDGEGSLHLNVSDDDSILDIMGFPLGGNGIGNGEFTSGPDYIMAKTIIVQDSKIFYSVGKYDGWILESRSDSKRGGKRNTKDDVFYLGDDAKDRQYRTILHFDISLPDGILISKVLLRVKRKGTVGVDPFALQEKIQVDLKSGVFGTFGPFPIKYLQRSDFQSPASIETVGTIENNPIEEWYWASLDSAAFAYITQADTLQFRLRFDLSTNANQQPEYFEFFSGDSENVEDHPQLLIEYYEKSNYE